MNNTRNCKRTQLFLGQAVSVPLFNVIDVCFDRGIPISTGVINRGQITIVILGQMRLRNVFLQRRHLGTMEEDLI